MANASMAFDPETLEPTFRFVPDIPGASHALTIAESLGLPETVLARARALRDDEAAAVDGLLADLVERERRLEGLLADAERDRRKAELLNEEWERRLAGVKDERKELKVRALAEARETLEQAQSLVEETVREIKAKEAARATIKEAREKLRARRAEIAREIELEQRASEPETGRPPATLAPGMRVRIAGLGREGELLSLPDGRGNVRVRVGNATLEVSGDELREASGEERRRRTEVSIDVEGAEESANELHLRGATTDEVRDAIERHVSLALLQGLSMIRIVHGKGTGALRDETHAVLRTMPSVKSFRLGRWGEGDTGVTIVELK
jgi:DNA mismatch repair protein MutS2